MPSMMLWLPSCSTETEAHTLSYAVDTSTLSGKLIMGYQGWFSCPADSPNGQWGHWFSNNQPTIDMLPDLNELPSESTCDTDLVAANGQPIRLYSSGSPPVTELHFSWMEKYGLDGVALQRFGVILSQPKLVAKADDVLKNVRAAAERHHRAFFVMYDLSGMQPNDLQNLAKDWEHIKSLGILSSKAYLHHQGHPLLGIWGFGFSGRPLQPIDARNLITELRRSSTKTGGITILGGVPASWRTGSGDAAQGWDGVWPMLNVISPWTVGRYADENGIDSYRKSFIDPDLVETRRLGIDYMPVVFPGFSWANLMRVRNNPMHPGLNGIPRRCGRFYWRQIFSELGASVTMIYGAMFDEVDEGTAMYKTLPTAKQVPGSGTREGEAFLSLDADGCELPSDWYLQLAGQATDYVHRHALPPPELPMKLP